MAKQRSRRLEEFLDSMRNEGGFKDFEDISEQAWCGDTALHRAVRFFENEVVPELVELGIDINTEGDMKQTPLHIAVNVNNFEMAEWLIQNGANLVAIDELLAQPPFFSALLSENDEMLNLLFQQIFGKVKESNDKTINDSWVKFHTEQRDRLLKLTLDQND